jgi:hypothetical protein
MRFKNFALGISATLAGVLALGLFTGFAEAQAIFIQTTPVQTGPTGPHPTRLAGNVTSVSSNGLVLATRQGDFTINVSASTWVVVQKNGAAAQGTLADIVTGQPAVVGGMTTSDPKVVDARTVAQGPKANGGARPNAPRGNRGAPGRAAAGIVQHVAAGTITAINGSTITLKGEKVAEVTVKTTASTVVLNGGFVAVSSLKVGDKVQVLGAPEKPATAPTTPANPGTPNTPRTRPQVPASRTIDAWGIRVDNGTTKLSMGQVTAVNGNVLTVKTPENRGGLTVNVDSSTAYRVLTIANQTASLGSAALSNVQVGSNLIVDGALSSDGKSLSAKAVIILPSKPRLR